MPSLLQSLLVVTGSALASMGVYALRGGQRDADAEAKRAQFLGGLGDFLLHWFLWLIAPLTRLALRLGLTPLVFNYLGLVAGVLAGALMAWGALELGAVALLLSGICDILDGRIARTTAQVSARGAFIDSVFDRYTETCVFLGLLIYLRHTTWGAFAAAAALATGLLVSYARARGESLGVRCTAGFMQRGERLALVCAAGLLDPSLMPWLGLPAGTGVASALVLIAGASLVTAIHRTVWIAVRLGGS